MLQAIKEALETLQPSVEAAQQHEDEVLNNSTPEDAARVQKLMEEVRVHWSRVDTQYNQNHR